MADDRRPDSVPHGQLQHPMKTDWQQAVGNGDASLCQQLIEAGADINARDRYGQTAVMIAARQGFTELVRLLVDNGAELDHTAKYKLSALMLAVVNDHAAIVRLLLEAGARTDLRGSGAPGFHGRTALDLARAMNRLEIATILRM